jgi:diguanylate cyclase (GGDEF)-like protein
VDDEAIAVTPSGEQVMSIVAAGQHGSLSTAMSRIGTLIPLLERSAEPELLLLGLWGQAALQREAEALPETQVTTDLLEQAALERNSPVWVAVARAVRATVRLDAGDVGASMADLARVDLDQLADRLIGTAGHKLLDVLAMAYSRLRLHDRVDDVRARIEETISDRPPLDRALHWAHWATELAERAMEPFAAGTGDPDQRVLAQAVDVATRISTVPLDLVPDRLRRGADGVRALAAAYRGRPAEALRLLGQDAYRQPADLSGMSRQLTVLAAIRAHVLDGSVELAMTLDDQAAPPLASTSHLVLEVCRARERLALQNRTGADVSVVVNRLSQVLAQLAWQGMDVMAEAARQALEHQALRVESRTDALTGVGNRRALDEELRNLLRFSPLPLSLVLVDIDSFKLINDRFTHVVGDEVLRRVAGSLSPLLRTGDRLARYGGDEFVVLLPLAGDTEAEAVASRMTQTVSELPWHELAEGLTVRITTGSATLWSLSHRRPDGDAEHLFRLADERLLQAKHRAMSDAPDPKPDARPDAGLDSAADPAPDADPADPADPAGPAGLTQSAGPVDPPQPAAPVSVSPAPRPHRPGRPLSRRRRTAHGDGSDRTGADLPDLDPARLPVDADSADASAEPAAEPAGTEPAVERPLDRAVEPPAPAAASGRNGVNGSADDPAAEYGRATAASLQLPFSPAAGLPLYRALLADPPRVDPYLGTLPPAGQTWFTTGPALPLRQRPTSAAAPHDELEDLDDVELDDEDDDLAGDLAGAFDGAPTPAVNGIDHGSGLDDLDDLEDPEDDQAEAPDPDPVLRAARPRRRPQVIDLSGDEDRRFPFS